jgi:AraC-like DNA-binding protein
MKLSDLLRLMEKQTGAVICMEPRHPAFSSVDDLRLQPDQYLHHGPYCVFAKQAGGMQVCSDNKARSMKLAEKERAFSGVCPHGLRELVQPVLIDSSLAAVLYAGHFASDRKLAVISGKHYSGRLPPALTADSEHELRRQLRLAAALICWEIALWKKQGGHGGRRHDEQYYLDQVDFFIAHRYAENISLAELADTLKVNPNYLGGIIRRRAGYNFRQMLNRRRIEEAKTYLRFHSRLNISEIAAMSGFADSNYFSTVFRQITGMTPRACRQGK